MKVYSTCFRGSPYTDKYEYFKVNLKNNMCLFIFSFLKNSAQKVSIMLLAFITYVSSKPFAYGISIFSL
ncbi:hypothetical protein CKQ54_13110 [Rahnella variigena]|uniref:Uncharacterized protein n=1 Tax=Rahnella variigena TaxID=574964 RepID=A0ABX9PYE1_9GAMM|nr:hypothetical protein D6D38_19845 [Rahnella variigena]RKF69246.1 hypothetical protein CKQ54_13110 [Rahnella variigena]